MATAHTPAIEELLDVHALGALDGEDLRAVEEHLAGGCPECARRLPELEGDLEKLASAAPPVAPSAAVRARLLEALDERPPAFASPPARGSQPPQAGAVPAPLTPPALRTAPRRAPAWSWLVAAAAILLLVWGVSTRSSLSREVGSLRAELAGIRADRDQTAQRATELAGRLANAEADNERLAQAMAIISSPAMKPVALAGLKDAPGARGHAFVDPQARRAVFVAAGLPALAPGKTYELWFIAGVKPVRASTFAVDGKGSATVRVANLPSANLVWAVTIEPRGGVPQPTGVMVLKG
jgi:hypothetical protein